MDTEGFADYDIPWKRRYFVPAYLVSELARHDPGRGIILANLDGRQGYFSWELESGRMVPVIPAPASVSWTTLPWALISPSGRYIYSFLPKSDSILESATQGFLIRRPFGGGKPEFIAPELGPLFPTGFALAGNGGRLGFLRVTEHARKDTELYCIDLDQDETLKPARLVAAGSGLLHGLQLSADGRLAFVGYKVFGGPDHGVRVTDTATGLITASLSVQGVCLEPCAVAPEPGDTRVVLMSEAGSRISIVVWNSSNGNIDYLPYEGDHGSLRMADWAPDGDNLLIDRFEKARQTLLVHSIHRGTSVTLPFRGRSFCTYFKGKDTVVAHRSDIDLPSAVISYQVDKQFGLPEFNLSPGSTRFLDKSPQVLPEPVTVLQEPAQVLSVREKLVLATSAVPPCRPWKELWFASSDGTPVQGWLCLPEGTGPFPTVIDIHGGPFLARAESYQPEAQAWADNGYAWFSVNYRGSIGFGSSFSGAIRGDPGSLEVEDLEAARHRLIADNLARPDAIFLTGWSYGAFLALLTLGLKPALWSGAVVGNAMADWTSGYSELDDAGKANMESLFDGSPEDKPQAFIKASPISYVTAVCSPCLVVQAQNDGITPPGQLRLFERAMKASGKPIEVYWYQGSHGSHQEDSALALELFERMLGFLKSIRP